MFVVHITASNLFDHGIPRLMSRSLRRQICIQYVDLMWQAILLTVYYHFFPFADEISQNVP